MSEGATVANPFAYTGGFSVHAAAVGARHVTTVDISEPALDDARENFRLNGIDPGSHAFEAADAFGWTHPTPWTSSSATPNPLSARGRTGPQRWRTGTSTGRWVHMSVREVSSQGPAPRAFTRAVGAAVRDGLRNAGRWAWSGELLNHPTIRSPSTNWKVDTRVRRVAAARADVVPLTAVHSPPWLLRPHTRAPTAHTCSSNPRQGGMSEVELARKAVDDARYVRFVVIKRIHARHTAEPGFIRMFQDEARINAELQHENIAQVYDFDMSGTSGTSRWNMCRGSTSGACSAGPSTGRAAAGAYRGPHRLRCPEGPAVRPRTRGHVRPPDEHRTDVNPRT